VDLEIEVESTDIVTWLDLDGNVLQTGNQFSVLSIPETTSYQISVVDDTGCELRDTFEVEVYQDIDLTITGGSTDLFYCEGQSINLSADTQVNADIDWVLNDDVIATGPTLTDFIPEGDITIVAISVDEFGCIESDTFNVRQSSLNGQLTGDENVCYGDNATFEFIPENPQGDYDLVWTPADAIVSSQGNFATVDPLVATEITVQYINADNCTDSYTYSTNLVGFPSEANAFADPVGILLGQSSQLSTDQDSNLNYVWSPAGSLDNANSATPLASPEETTLYSVTITDVFGCMTQAEVQVVVDQPSCNENDIFIPNMFTPNNDGENDVFEIHSNFIDEMRLIIYDRWGEEVFESTNQADTWDGTYENKELEPDVFGYHLMARCINGFKYTTQGNITLMK